MTYRVADLRAFDRQFLMDGRARRPRYLELEPDCWMCPARGRPKTREHVFGRWIMKRLPRDLLTFEPHRAGPFGLDHSDVRGPMGLDALKVGRVCGTCNGGWMSALEVDAARLVFERARDLDDDDACRLAHWALKTAVMLNVSQPSPLIWTEADRHKVQSGPFARTAVSVLRVDGADVNWAQGEQKVGRVQHDPLEVAALLSMAPTVRIRLNDIVLVVARLPWQMSNCTVTLPGRMVWDGERAHAVDLAALPLIGDWLDGLVMIEGALTSSFWTRPTRDFWWTGAAAQVDYN